jgi:hypothetical protein
MFLIVIFVAASVLNVVQVQKEHFARFKPLADAKLVELNQKSVEAMKIEKAKKEAEEKAKNASLPLVKIDNKPPTPVIKQ